MQSTLMTCCYRSWKSTSLQHRGIYAGDTQQDCMDQDLSHFSQHHQNNLHGFQPSTKKQEAKLKMNGQSIAEDPLPTYLGVTVDRRLTWKQQINKCCSQAKMRLAIMKKLTGTDWGADQRILKKLYRGRELYTCGRVWDFSMGHCFKI